MTFTDKRETFILEEGVLVIWSVKILVWLKYIYFMIGDTKENSRLVKIYKKGVK